jgi:hypothetical protein
MGLVCPKCESSDVRRLSLIYDSGTADMAMASLTVGVSKGQDGMGFGAAPTLTRGTQQSHLARQAAPPAEKIENTGCTLSFAIALSLMGALFLSEDRSSSGAVAAMALGAITGVIGTWKQSEASRYNREEWPPLRHTWERSFLCTRSGDRFEISI